MKRRPPPLDIPYPRHRPASPEEVELWNEEAGGKKNRKERQPIVPTQISAVKSPASPPLASAPVTPLPASAGPRLDSRMRAKIRKGAIAIEAVLDLHGHTRASAHGVLMRFILEAQARGLRTVLVITGKGRLAGAKGVLGEWLERMVAEPQLRERIIACEPAAPRHGGSGAWYVRVRRPASHNR